MAVEKSLYKRCEFEMTQLFILTEEPSITSVIEETLNKILPEGVYFQILSHEGKNDLENAITKTLPSLSKMPGVRIIVTRDMDEWDCRELKEHLLGLINGNCHCPHLIRIVCRNLESWLLGDLEAIQLAYNRFSPSHHKYTEEFRNVDNIGNPTDRLHRIVPELSDRLRLPKVEVARTISPYMDIQRNKSASFQCFVSGVRKLIES
jgi:hypothetical protein